VTALVRKAIIIGLFYLLFPLTAQEMDGKKIRIGILNPQVEEGNKTFILEIIKHFKNSLTDMGIYEIYTQDMIEQSL
jgi:hypothetical protein